MDDHASHVETAIGIIGGTILLALALMVQWPRGTAVAGHHEVYPATTWSCTRLAHIQPACGLVTTPARYYLCTTALACDQQVDAWLYESIPNQAPWSDVDAIRRWEHQP